MATGLTLSVQQLQALLDAPMSEPGSNSPEPILSRVVPAASFTVKNIGPPSFTYIDQQEVIQLALWNAVGGTTIEFSGRWLSTDGSIRKIDELFFPAGDRTLQSFGVFTAEGFLLNFTVRAQAGTVLHGQCYARVLIVSTGKSGGFATANLVSGYLSSLSPIFWPGGGSEAPGDGQGAFRSITGTNPAAGLEWSETVPVSTIWRIRSIRATLVTGAGATARTGALLIDDGTNNLMIIPPTTSQAANLSNNYNASSQAAVNTLFPTNLYWQIPNDLRLFAGYRFQSFTGNLVAADDWGAPQYQVEEWITV